MRFANLSSTKDLMFLVEFVFIGIILPINTIARFTCILIKLCTGVEWSHINNP